MYYLLDKKYDETFTINFLGLEEFEPGEKLILEMPECVYGITEITSFTDNVEGETDSVYLKKYFQYKQGVNGVMSDPLPIEEITSIEICTTKCIQFNILYYRMDDGGPQPGVTITLNNASIGGIFKFTSNDDPFVLNSDNPIQIFNVGDKLKIFSIDSFEVISTARYGNAFDIKYRFTQDDGLSFTEWEPLSQENISTVQWDKLRFVNLQYMFEYSEGYNTPVKIYDVILYGDFQNVSANSLKLNLFGLKENCINLYYAGAEIDSSMSGINEDLEPYYVNGDESSTESLIKENSEYQLRMNWLTQGMKCYSNPDLGGKTPLESLEEENANAGGGFWNPYEFGKITKFHDFLAGTINDMLGFSIDYHRTDPDSNGIDSIIHEYQLHNVVDMKTIKVLVPDNQFPDNQIVINQFNLDLFDTFKINILKQEYKEAFGVETRPGQEDILYFCQINRMYIVKHAQIHKDVMNAGIYYNVVLEKYEKRANVLNRMEESKDKIDALTKNTTIDELFGFEKDQDTLQIANKKQMKPKTFDFIRNSINSRMIYNKQEIYNGDIKIIESMYFLENVAADEDAVNYVTQDNNVLKSDNRSFTFWVNFPNLYDPNRAIVKDVIEAYDIPDNTIYNFIDNMDSDGQGYRIWYQNDAIWFMMNDYIEKIPITLMTNIWYAVVVNLDQRQRKFSTKVYRRNTAVEVILYNPKTYERLELNLDTDMVDIEYEMNVNGFRAVDNIEIASNEVKSIFIEMDSYEHDMVEPYEFSHDEKLSIKGSRMYISNIRILNDLIKEKDEQTILNELIIKDAQHVIIADNCEKKIQAENIFNKNWR